MPLSQYNSGSMEHIMAGSDSDRDRDRGGPKVSEKVSEKLALKEKGQKGGGRIYVRPRVSSGKRFIVVAACASLLLLLVATKHRGPTADRFAIRDVGEDDRMAGKLLVAKIAAAERCRPKLLIVTAIPSTCQGMLPAQIMKNRNDYARRHGMDVYFFLSDIDPELKDSWQKIAILRKYEWLWWLDHESVITDMRLALPLPKYADKMLVLGPSEEWSKWSEEFLERMIMTGKQALIEGTEIHGWIRETVRDMAVVSDQAVLVYMLFHEKDKTRDLVLFETMKLGGLAESWVAASEHLTSLELSPSRVPDGNSPPFVVHFEGCHLCEADGMSSACASKFATAFNFADNQVLGALKLRHTDLTSSAIQDLPQPGID
eukprot:jgi/Mesen1/6097/ME000031S05371